ncbi:MAG: GNAT family N-acetyltransferase [Candidatus Brocadiaceae bacterium]|nr:GNAT family N-acetyltransferase [Candidatus Brocadiaceae bacterium]
MDEDIWTLHKAKQNFEAYREEWDNLNATLYDSHPLLDSNFITPLVKYFADDNSHLAILSRGNSTQAMALLQNNNLIKWSSFLPSQLQISPVLFKDKDQAISLIKQLPFSVLMLDILAQDPLYSPFYGKEISKSNLSRMHHAITINVSVQGTFEAFWDLRSKNLKRNVSRYINRINKNGLDLNLVINTNTNEVIDSLNRYGQLESSGWKAATGTAISPNNIQGKFYADVLNNFSHLNNSKVYELYIDNKLAASRLVIQNKQILIILKTTYDETIKKYSPGRMLLYLLIQNIFENKVVKYIEFYTNANKDQISWADTTRSIEHVTVYRNDFIMKTHNILSLLTNKSKQN